MKRFDEVRAVIVMCALVSMGGCALDGDETDANLQESNFNAVQQREQACTATCDPPTWEWSPRLGARPASLRAQLIRAM